MPKGRKGRRHRELTLKQTKLVKELPTATSVAEAGRRAGYAGRQEAHDAMKSIREKMPDVLERHGLTPDFAADKCRQLMNAKETKFFSHQGIVLEQKEVDALDIQLRALDAWAKMYGAFREDKIQVDVNHSYNIDLSRVPDSVIFGILEVAPLRPSGSSQDSGRGL